MATTSDTTSSVTAVTAVLLVDDRVQQYQTIVASVKDNVRVIVYDVNSLVYTTMTDFIKAKIAELNIASFSSIGIVEYNEHRDFYNLFGPHTQPSLITSVITSEPNLDSWAHVADFITYLKNTYSIQNFDMIACALYASNDWKYIIDTLTTSTGVQIRASTDKTGSSVFGGDWTLESTGTDIDLKTVYFNENIENYEGVLDITGTITNTIPTPFFPYYGTENGFFLWPRSCRFYNNRIYVSDSANGRVQIFDLSLNYITKFENRIGASLYDVGDIVIHPTNGRIYVAGSNRINAFDASFNYLFSSPFISSVRAIAMDNSGFIYGSMGYEIRKYDSSCNFVGTFMNNNGSGDGQINNASGMIFDSSNNFWISDEGQYNSTLNHRVQKFDSNGNFLMKFGSGGSADTSFNIPYYLNFDAQGNIYVPDFRNDRVKKFTNTGTFLMSFGGNTAPSDGNRPEPGKLDGPIGVAVDTNGDVYIVEYNNNRLQKFSSAGVSLAARSDLTTSSSSAQGYFNMPWGVAVHPPNGNIYVVDQGNNRIQKFNSSSSFVWSVGSLGSGDSSFNQPRYLAIDTNENIYVTDRNNHTVKMFNSSGVYQRRISSGFGNSYGQLNNPGGIVVDTSFNVYVSDNNSRVQMFDASGVYVNQFYLGHVPRSLSMDSARNLYVTSTTNNSNVYKYPTVNPTVDVSINTVLNTISVGNVAQYMAVTSDESRLLMSNSGNGTVIVFNLKTLTTITTVNVGDGPTGIVINSTDTLAYVTMWNGNSVNVINLSTYQVVATIAVGGRPYNLAINPTNTRIYVVNSTGASVSVIDTATNTVLTTISVGNNPRNISIDNTGTYALVSVSDENRVKRILLSDNSITHTITVGSYPRSVCFNSQNTLAFVNNGGTTTVSVINLSTFTVTSTITVGLNPQSNAISNNFLYVSNESGDSISVVSLSNYSVSTYSIGDGPHALVMGPSKRFVYVALYNENVLKIISAPQSASLTLTSQGTNITGISVDSTTNNFITVQESGQPRFKMYDPSGTVIFSSNLSVNSGQGVFLYNDSTTLFYTDTYTHGVKKVTLSGLDASPVYQSISQVTKTFGVDASFSLTAVMTGISNSSGAYTFSSANAGGAITISGGVATINAYTPSAITVTASQAAASGYTTGSTTFAVLINRGTPTYQSISQVTKTFGVDASFSLAAVVAGVSNSSGAYTFSSSNTAAVSVSGDVATINAYTPSAITITASQDASGNYAASSTTFTVIVNGATPTYQSISQVTKTFGVDTTFSLAAVVAGASNSSGAYTFSSSDTAAVSVAGSVATINAYTPSAITITASQDASGNYTSGSTTFTVLVARGTPNYQSISQVTKTVGVDVSFSLAAVMVGVSNSSGAYTFTSADAGGAVSIAGNVATINAYTPSAITVTATQDASGNYAASSTTFTLLVNRKTPSYGAFSVPAATYGDASFSIAAYAPTTDSTTVPFTYTSSDVAVATINSDGTVVTVIGQGYTTITASQEASGNYAAGSTTTSFLVNRAAPTFLRAFTIPNKTFGTDVSFALLPLTDGLDNTDGAYTFTSSNAEIVAISEDGLTATILGYTPSTPVTIYVAIDACGNYAASSTSGTVTIARGTPAYQSVSQVTKTFGDAAFSLTSIMSGVSNSNGAYTFTSSNTSAVSIGGVNGDTATILAYTPSAVTITASQAASGNYGASSTTFTVLVNRKTPTLGAFTLGSLDGYYDVSNVSFTLTAPTSDSSAAFAYSSSNTSVAVITDTSYSTTGITARYDPSHPDGLMLSGGNVSGLVNLEGSSGYNLVPTSGNPPSVTVNSLTMINGENHLGFYRSLPLTSNLTICMVIRYNPSNSTVNNYGSLFQHGSLFTDVSIIKKHDTSHTFVLVSNNNSDIPMITLVPNRSYVLVGRFTANSNLREFWAYSDTGTTTYTYMTGISVNSVASSTFYLGGSSASAKSYFGEVLYYNASITENALSDNVNYLRKKWFNAAITMSKQVRFIGSGTSTITASQDISGNYAAGSTSRLLRVGATVPTFGEFTVSATTKTYGDTPFTLTPPTTNSDGAFSFSSDNTSIISIAGTTATILAGGTVTISVTQDPSGSFTRKTVSQSITVLKKSPNLANFPPITVSFADSSYNMTPPTTDNPSPTFSYILTSGSAVAINNSNVAKLTIMSGGTASITATIAETAQYNSQAIHTTVTVTPIAPTNSYSAFSRAFDVGTFTIPAPTTNNSGSAITYTSSDTSVATIAGSTATILKVGTTVITATIAANASYLQSDISAVLTVTKGTPTMTGSGLISRSITMTTEPSIPIASSTSNGTFTYASDNSAIVSVTNSNTINPVSVGAATITATISEDTSGNYNSRSTTFVITVVRATSNLSSATFTVPSTMTYGDTPVSITVAPTSNNTSAPIVYSSSNVNIATIDASSGVITAQGSGSVYFIATQAQTSVYNMNSRNSNNMSVSAKPVTQTKNAPYTGSTISMNYGDPSFNLSTTSEGTGSILYSSFPSGIVTIANPTGRAGVITIVNVGTTTITATQLGNARYVPQNTPSWTLTVSKGTTALTGLAATLTKNVTDAPFYVSATSASAGTKSYALANPGDTTVLTVNGSTGLVTLKGAGSATVVISQAASSLYNAPASVSCAITVNEAGTSLQGATLSSDRVFTNVDMTGATLSNSTITSVSFAGATLTNAVMSSSTVRNAVMTSATFTGASFASADISGTDFTNSTLSSANMANTVLTNSVMTNAVLTGAALTNATITRTTFTGATVRSANLTGATLTDSTLTSADLSGSILRAANVAGSSFVGAVLANTDLSGAVVTNANFTNANIRGADITNVAFSPLQKLQLLKNLNNRDIGGVQVSDVSGSVLLSAISESSPAASIPNISNATIKVVIPTTTTVAGDTIPNVTLDTTTNDKFYFPINTDEYFQIEGVKYYVSEGVIKRQSDNVTVSVVNYGNRRIWLIAGSVIASVLQLNTISSSTFTVESYKLDTDGPFSITTAPTSNSPAPIVYSSNNPSVATINSSTGLITIHKQGYVNFIATQADTDLYEGGSKTSNELFVNKLINFTLTGLNQAIFMSTLGSLDASAVSLENTDAAAVFYVKQSDMMSVFKFQSDSNDMNEAASSDVKYYVFDRNWPAELKINPLHAMMNKSESANMLGNAESFAANKMLVKHDFIRYLSLCLFNTIHGVDLFRNENDLLENAVYGGETIRNTIHGLLGNVGTTSSEEGMSYDVSGNKYLTNDASGNTNLCRELLRQMVAGAPARFGSITDANTPQSLPFEVDDTINFKVTLQAAPTQNLLTGVTEIPVRSYLIKLIIKSSVTGGDVNTAVVDSEMYPNAYPYSSSVVSYAPTSASSSVYNSYSPPAPIPFSRFGFNGWYYTNSTAWVSVASSVRNHVKWLVPANSAGSSTVGGLQYIRVNLKIHNKTALPYVMVYTQSGSYRKYVVSGGSGALTNGTKYTFYINFNSYTQEPAVAGYTNALLTSSIGAGNFLNSEFISSIAVETDSNASAGSVEFTLGGMIVGDIVAGVSGEKEYGFLADVPAAYP